MTAIFRLELSSTFLRLQRAGKDELLSNNKKAHNDALQERHNPNRYIAEDGHIRVKNLSAYWLPDFTLQKVIGGTLYSVSGSYDGTETIDKKLHRILTQQGIGDIHDL